MIINITPARPDSFSIMRSPTRETRQQKYERKRAEFIAANPTPYTEWPNVADGHCERVAAALAGGDAGTWRKSVKERVRKLSIIDLAVGLWAVWCNNGDGLNYGQLGAAFRACVGVGCHRAKAAAILARLMELRLIEKIGNYSVGGRGNVYRGRKKTETEMERDIAELVKGLSR
jgi:hypothetical protein